jgi:hypothetical protein
MPEFIPGLRLSNAFYWQAVRPILDAHFTNLVHAAGRIGSGSEILGFDSEVSADHEWGPQLTLFLAPEQFEELKPAIHETLRQELPVRFMGYSTHFGAPDPNDNGVQVREDIEHGPVDHHINFDTIASLWQRYLGIEPFQEPTASDWLTFSDQSLLGLTAGKVFHDGLGLEEVRKRFAYFPKDVWLYLLAFQWNMISQEEAFVGRTSSTGDELGSRIITARLMERLMHLCFLMEKRYAPYSKWLGRSFRDLACYPRMGPLLEGAVAANNYPERERYLAQAYSLAAEMHNALGITPPLETRTRTYSGWHALRGGITDLPLDAPGNTRPFQCIFATRFSDAITASIHDPEVRALVPNKGSVSQFLVESSGALQDVPFCRRLKDDLINEI